MIRKIILTLLVLSVSFALKAQNELPPNAKWKDTAVFYIRELKEGALLFRLHSRSKAVEQLNNSGNYSQANNIVKEQREENLEIVHAFKTYFPFCKVYFCYADSTEAWLKGKRSGFLLNDSLEVDPSIVMNEKFSLLAEKGTPQKHAAYDRTQPQNERTEPGYLGEAIVLYDHNLRMLKSPFPSYAKESFPQNLGGASWKVKVQSLNKKLTNFYQLNKEKE